MARGETPFTQDQTALSVLISVDIVVRQCRPTMESANENHTKHSKENDKTVDYKGAIQEILKDVFGE